MRRDLKLLFCLAILALTTIAFAQEPSLGDVARQERKRQASKPANTASKVVTDEDMPSHPEAEDLTAQPGSDEEDAATGQANGSSTSEPRAGHTAQEWKAQILAQKRAVAVQQQQVDRMRASIHFVEANRYWNGAQYNERQRRRQIQVEQMQKQLEQQKKRLEDMQEAARRAGFGNSVYDPNN